MLVALTLQKYERGIFMKRVLCLISCMNTGGAKTFLMKIYRQIDKTKYQMDFGANIQQKGFYDNEITALGGKIYYIPSKSSNVREFKKQLDELIRKEKYEVVLRITSSAAGFLDLKVAKKAGVKRCCVRSSNSSDGGSMLSVIAHRMGRLLYDKYVDVKIAPSDLAAKYTFGKKAYDSHEVNILHNAVDTSIFQYKESYRSKIRNELDIEKDAVVIGHVGRFYEQKNHIFLIKIFEEICKINKDALLLLVGDGPLEGSVREMIENRHLENRVIFLGVRSDIDQILSAMDVFVLPSLYEGMPNVVIEAQATGLPVILSDTITQEVNITGLVDFCSLSEVESVWAKKVLSKIGIKRESREQQFIKEQYDIQSVADQFIKIIFGD